MHSQYVHSKHPPDEENRDDGPRDVNYPVASCFRFSKIEHAAMVAGPANCGVVSPLRSLTLCSGVLSVTAWLTAVDFRFVRHPPVIAR